MWKVVAQRGERQQLVAQDLDASAATRLRSLLAALQTDGDPIVYVVQQQTGFLFMAVAHIARGPQF